MEFSKKIAFKDEDNYLALIPGTIDHLKAFYNRGYLKSK